MKKTIIIIICFVLTVLFSRDVSSQNTELDLPNFQGSYDARNSAYSLLIEKDSLENYKFISYSFVSNLDEDGYIYYERQPAPGIEKFRKKEDNKILTTYWIPQQDYYVTVTYGFASDEVLLATFEGTYKGEPYFNQIEYYKLNTKDYAVKK